MAEDRIDIKKTYKMYIGGDFPRSESGRTYKALNADGNLLANACLGSRKDFRDAVKTARSAFSGWSSRSAYNRGQILYRIAEMLEDRRDQFMKELGPIGFKTAEAEADINASIDRLIYYAGWTDKYQQVLDRSIPSPVLILISVCLSLQGLSLPLLLKRARCLDWFQLWHLS